ncbi:MAG: thiamine pyrophosphate-dependent enzyme [bacterium]
MSDALVRTPVFPTWCPGCGNFGIWGAFKMALKELAIPEEKLVVVFDVGCSGNMTDFVPVFGFHALHGRSIPIAEGISMANHDLTIIVIGGDGGIYGEGMGHFISACKGNHNITLLVHDNQTYGLTKGQTSPTTCKGVKTGSTPQGVIEEPINPIAMAITAKATWVGRSYATNIPFTKDMIIKAIKHQGFSVLDIFQPCVTFNKLNTQAWFKERITQLPTEYKPDSRLEAWELAEQEDKLPIGVFYEDSVAQPYHELLPQLGEKTLQSQFATQLDLTPAMSEFA